MEIQREEWKFLEILIGLAVIGVAFIVASHFFPSHWLIRRSVALAIGESLLVAAILGVTVDRYIKEFLVRKASNELFKYLVGYKLPAELQDRLRDLMGTPVIRRNYVVNYTLTPLPDQMILLDAKYSFDLYNVSTHIIQGSKAKLEIEKHYNPSILELRCDSENAQFRKFAKPGGTIGQESKDVPGVIEAIGDPIDLQPAGDPPKLNYRISGHYQLHAPENSSDTLSFVDPTVDITVTAECPDDFQFVIEGAKITTPNLWRFPDHAFLSSEHVRVRWFKKN